MKDQLDSVQLTPVRLERSKYSAKAMGLSFVCALAVQNAPCNLDEASNSMMLH
jgi:hypothetical protein